MATYSRTFHGGFKITLVFEEDPMVVVDKILDKEGLKREVENDFENPQGLTIYCFNSHIVLWFPTRPKKKDAGTVAHEVFHAWHYWNHYMNRELNPTINRVAELEVDAYFFSDVVDWIYKCARKN